MKRNSKLTIKTLERFIVNAHNNTYAGNGIKVSSSRLSSEDFEFTEKNLTYHDTYFGDFCFIGQEIVYECNKPVWGMNYYGKELTKGINTKTIFSFLKEALSQKVNEILPVRGPKNYRKKLFTYTNTCNGTLEDFYGVEKINLKNKTIYQCSYQGGSILGKED